MTKGSDKLLARLEKIWEPPNLFEFFEKYSKRPPHLVKKGIVLFNAGDPLKRILPSPRRASRICC